MKESILYKKLADKKVQCKTCNHHCVIAPGKRGICGVRENTDGKLNLLVYGRTIAANVDPIEKKPLFHYLPGTTAFSLATAGCNFDCKFCQNWRIAQFRPEQVEYHPLPPQQAVEVCKRRHYTDRLRGG